MTTLKTITNLEELYDFIGDTLATTDYKVVAFRGLSQHDIRILQDNDSLDKSIDTSQLEDIDNRTIPEFYADNVPLLSGTSGLEIEDINRVDEFNVNKMQEVFENAKGYSEFHHNVGKVALIAGNSYDLGEDKGEIIINDCGYGATVVAYIDLQF